MQPRGSQSEPSLSTFQGYMKLGQFLILCVVTVDIIGLPYVSLCGPGRFYKRQKLLSTGTSGACWLNTAD